MVRGYQTGSTLPLSKRGGGGAALSESTCRSSDACGPPLGAAAAGPGAAPGAGPAPGPGAPKPAGSTPDAARDDALRLG